MSKIKELLHQGRYDELWQMCCGFIDLSLDQFMSIQRRLLLEQIELLKNCELGRKIMRGAIPETIEEFREIVPLTTYSDYCPELLERREDVLPTKPVLWQRTSGRYDKYPCKWVPLSARFCQELVKVMMAAIIFCGCERREVSNKLKEHLKMIYAVAPRPYTSGTLVYIMQQEFPFDCLPSLKQAETMSFEDRIKEGFRQALSQGFDGFCGLSLALVAVGEAIRHRAQKVELASLLSQPKALFRLTKGLIKSKLARRPMLPKDLWSLKGIISGGTDSSVLKEKIKTLWGRYPLDIYAATESGIIATQTWDYEGMTFVPNLNFLEFIPEEEHFKGKRDSNYQPKTVLLDEVKPGEVYEIVITNFHGGALVRYRIGDMIRITSLRNDKLGIDIPQMIFERRADDLIDLGGYVRLTERTIWEAIEKSGIPYEDWIARKEIGEKPKLHIYIELKNDYKVSEFEIANAIYTEIKNLHDGITQLAFQTLESIVGTIPIKVSLLPTGAFATYIAQRRAEGADLAHIKPPHINPSDKVLSLLGVKIEAPEEIKTIAQAEITTVAQS